MYPLAKRFSDICRKTKSNFALTILIGCHILVCCLSLVYVARYQTYIPFHAERLLQAIVIVTVFSSMSLLFLRANFSFGYSVGFYFFTLIVGYLWIINFTQYRYNYKLAGISAAASLLVFLLPALFIRSPIRQRLALSPKGLDYTLKFLLALALVTIGTASSYNFRLISLDHIYDFRDQILFPGVVRYLIGIVSSTVLPYAFACFVALKRNWWAGATLLIMLLFYPITLSKFAFFAPAWLLTLLVLSKNFDARLATVLSLFLPILVGTIQIIPLAIMSDTAPFYFNLVNIRMFATPSSALDIYNDFFASHLHTYFCQISLLKFFMQCPYQEQISVVMEKAYHVGNLNASLFATEGVASVGLLWAPLVAFVCGLVIAVGNRMSADLPPRFVLISSGLLSQALANVPLSTVLLTHGALALFLLWYVTPRAVFGRSVLVDA